MCNIDNILIKKIELGGFKAMNIYASNYIFEEEK